MRPFAPHVRSWRRRADRFGACGREEYQSDRSTRTKETSVRSAHYAFCRSRRIASWKQDNEPSVAQIGTGSGELADIWALAVKYYSRGSFENVDNISGAKMTETILTGRSACQGCVIACGRVVKLGDTAKRKGPEYETVIGFGPNLLNDNLESIVDLGELCDRYGMDTISCTNTIGLAFTLFEKGILTQSIGGIELSGECGSHRKAVNLIGRREGMVRSCRWVRRFGAIWSGGGSGSGQGLETATTTTRCLRDGASYATSPVVHATINRLTSRGLGHTHESLGILI